MILVRVFHARLEPAIDNAPIHWFSLVEACLLVCDESILRFFGQLTLCRCALELHINKLAN